MTKGQPILHISPKSGNIASNSPNNRNAWKSTILIQTPPQQRRCTTGSWQSTTTSFKGKTAIKNPPESYSTLAPKNKIEKMTTVKVVSTIQELSMKVKVQPFLQGKSH